MQYISKKLVCLCTLLGVGMSWIDAGQAAGIDLPVSRQQIGDQSIQATVPQEESDAVQRVTDEWYAVSLDYLDEMRGGFSPDGDLKISFGIERAAYINGNLMTTVSFNIPDIGKITSEQASMLDATVGSVNLIQNGPGNIFQPGPQSHSATATVIQNTLNNQDIKSLTIINTTANSLELLKSLNLQLALKDGLTSSLVGR